MRIITKRKSARPTVQAKPLTPRELGLLRQWILEGAKAGSDAGTAASQLAWQSINAGLNAIYAVDTDAGGRFVAAGRAGSVTVYDLHAKDHVARLIDPLLTTSPQQQTHRDYVNAIAFDPGGQVLATAGYRNIKLWRRQSVRQPGGEPAAPRLTVAVSDGKLTLTRTADGAAFTCDATAAGTISRAILTSNNQALLLLDSGAVQPATLAEGGALTVGEPLKSGDGAVTDVQAAGGVVMFCVGNVLEIRAADAASVIRGIRHTSSFTSARLSPDGQRIATVDESGLAQLWNATDGKLIAALQVLSAVVASGRGLQELTSGFTPLPQVLVNVRIKKGFDITAHQAISDACERVERELVGRGRLLLRPSGTEPVIRVMVEGDETVAIDTLANEVAEAIRQAA